MTIFANILFTVNRPSYLETNRVMCSPADINNVLSCCIQKLDSNEKSWKITIEPTDIDYYLGYTE